MLVVSPLLSLLACLVACFVANLAGRVAVARALGAPIEEVGLFFGPTIPRSGTQGVGRW